MLQLFSSLLLLPYLILTFLSCTNKLFIRCIESSIYGILKLASLHVILNIWIKKKGKKKVSGTLNGKKNKT